MPEARRLCTRRPLLTGCKGRGEGGVAGVGGGWTPRYFICHWNWSELGRRNGRLTVVFGHGTETQTMGLTKRSPTGHRRWSRVLWTGLYIVGPLPPYASSGQALRLIDQGVVAGIQRRPRSRSTTIEIIFRGFVSNQLYTPGPNYAACRASFSADFVRTDNRILYPGHWKS